MRSIIDHRRSRWITLRHNVGSSISLLDKYKKVQSFFQIRTTLAVGAAYLAKKKAIVQKLSTIESLAGKHLAHQFWR